jgi:hypothetical protein
VEFGAHSVRHARLGRLNDAEAHWEITRSKSDCESLVGQEVRHFAYPYGDAMAAGEREAAISSKAGYSSAVTTESSTIFASDAARPFALPRLTFKGRIPHEPQLDLLLSELCPQSDGNGTRGALAPVSPCKAMLQPQTHYWGLCQRSPRRPQPDPGGKRTTVGARRRVLRWSPACAPT